MSPSHFLDSDYPPCYLPERADSEHIWTVTRQEIGDNKYGLKAVNPHAKNIEDPRTPEEFLDIIEAKGKGIADALATLRTKHSVR